MIALVDNLLDYMDESFFVDFRAQGHGPMIQFIWIYERGVDLDALRRFQHNLGKGLLGRCVEASSVPGGRSRWIAWRPPIDLDVAAQPRPRSELIPWTDEQAALPISLEIGPPWRLAVQPLAEGGAAVSLLVAHAVADGLGLSNSVADAVRGTGSEIGYPEPKSRTKADALLQDVGQLLRDLRHVAKALVLAPLAAKEVPMRRRAGLNTSPVCHDRDKQSTMRPSVASEFAVTPRLPSLTVLVDTQHWDEVAQSMGGTSNTLLIGFTSKLCDILGWLDSEGLVNLAIPVSERLPGDTRGNALNSASLRIDPARATDLRGIRAAVKGALTKLTQRRSRVTAPLALVPFLPTFVANRLQSILQRSANVTCSYVGDLDGAVNRPDGTEADWFYARHARTPAMADPELLRRAGGMFFPIASGRLGGRIYISICFSRADGFTTTGELNAAVRQALDEFRVSAIIECEPAQPLIA